MDVILHVGGHRTATTTLQRVLSKNNGAMQADRIAYWGPKRTRSDLFLGLLGNTDLAMPALGCRTDQAADQIALEIAALRSEGHLSLLISEENMLGGLRHNLYQRQLYPQAEARMFRLRTALASQVSKIAIAIRCYDRYWASSLGFGLSRGGPAPTPQVIDGLAAQPRRWRDVIKACKAAFPESELLVWTYEAMAARPDTQITEMIGRETSIAYNSEWYNTGPKPKKLNEVLIDRGDAPELIDARQTRFMPFSPYQRAQLRAHYADDLIWLRGGADGIARFIEMPAQDGPATEQGRGRSDERYTRHLA
jgi:hypothetical protein